MNQTVPLYPDQPIRSAYIKLFQVFINDGRSRHLWSTSKIRAVDFQIFHTFPYPAT